MANFIDAIDRQFVINLSFVICQTHLDCRYSVSCYPESEGKKPSIELGGSINAKWWDFSGKFINIYAVIPIYVVLDLMVKNYR